MISLLITNYNTWELTERCIRSVEHADPSQVIQEILVVDDCSTQGAPTYIQEHDLVKLVRNENNLGYVKSVNKAFAEATQPICLLLDSDAYLMSDVALIPQMFEEQKGLGILGFHLVDEHGKSTGRGGPEPDVWSLVLGQQLERSFRKLFPKRSKYITLYSCGIAIRKKAFEAIGGFDESFDFLDADHDFSMRMNRKGWQIAICDDIAIFHKGGGSPQLTSKRVIRFYENRTKLLAKHRKLVFRQISLGLTLLRLYLELIIVFFFSKSVTHEDKKAGRIGAINIIKDYLRK
ncbi:glycosyltransferase family 2 protein [Pedobacter glucosidilyticus]|uniref:glycosyltransferase family 2 protein n=1 Tax=Pedobacter glucosidilyticus TaxID=1122941 RepID=UPI00040CE225|nr:glycosyltransferase family 2 protein [Pedobacter glucosidilyticus]